MAAKLKAMRWEVVESIVWTWFLTLPATGLLAYGLMRLLQCLAPAQCPIQALGH